MRRKHALAVSVLLAGCVVAGTAAAMTTVRLGAAAAKPPHVADAIVAAQRTKLDRFAATLENARNAEPPELPRVPRYAPVAIPAIQSAHVLASAPTPAAAPAAPQAAPPPVKYVRPPPIVQTVQAPPQAPSAWSGDDGSGRDDHYGGGGDDDGGGGD